MKIQIEVLRTRTVTIDESATVEVEVPNHLTDPTDQAQYIHGELSDNRMKLDDSVFEASSENTDNEYHEVTVL